MIYVLDKVQNIVGKVTGVFSPQPAKWKGALGLHSVCLSVHLSIYPSLSPQYQFSRLFFLTLADIELIFDRWVNHHDVQIRFEFR